MLNAELAAKWPNITQKRDPLPEAEEMKGRENKRDLLKGV